VDQYPDGDSDGKDPELSHAQRQSMTPLDNQPSWHSRSNHDLMKHAAFTAGNKESLSERDPCLRMQFTDYLIRPVQQISTSTCPTYPQPWADGTYWNGCSCHGCKKGDGGCRGPPRQCKLFAPSATANFLALARAFLH
jgi:hypothetical protein